jgi:insertion element IS1 protein InsB
LIFSQFLAFFCFNKGGNLYGFEKEDAGNGHQIELLNPLSSNRHLMDCKYCTGSCIKKGWYKAIQKFQCRICKKYQRQEYSYRSYDASVSQQITLLNREGVGISSTSRLIKMPATSVQYKIEQVSKCTVPPGFNEINQEYEIDELCTYVGRNHPSCYRYIIYALNRRTKKITDYVIGARSKQNISRLVNRLMALSPKRIFTDKLGVFARVIDKAVHCVRPYKTNHIERNNLTLRTHLKRLSRKTICYSKSVVMLEACFRLYAWG